MSEKLLRYFKGDALAVSVWQGKYQKEGDETPDDMHRRMASEFALADKLMSPKENYQTGELSEYGRTRQVSTEESIYQMFKDFRYIVPQGSIMDQLGSESYGVLSNCFVVGQPENSYGGIMQKDEQLAQYMKRRGG